MNIDESLLAMLACPRCRAPVRADAEAEELVCTSSQCALAYPVREGIPVMLVDEARPTVDDIERDSHPGEG